MFSDLKRFCQQRMREAKILKSFIAAHFQTPSSNTLLGICSYGPSGEGKGGSASPTVTMKCAKRIRDPKYQIA